MTVTVKFFSSLMEYLPETVDGNSVEIPGAQGITPNQILDRYKVPYDEAQMMMRNGEFLPNENRDNPLQDGDKLGIWPTIQGG